MPEAAPDQELICPTHRTRLARNASGYTCAQCAAPFPVVEGVLRMLERPDEFYEGAYENKIKFEPKSERPWHIWPLWLLNSGYVWAVRRHVPRNAVLVELGCAGGVTYFGRRYRSIACDLSFSSLKLANSYGMRVQADAAACIPLPDGSVDAVVSSFFWEHIPPDLKPKIARECLRILKPGGKVVFLYDVETENPLIRRFKRKDLALYRQLFIEGDGHVGYETPAQNAEAFRNAGFRVLKHLGLEKTWLQHGSVYSKLARFPGGAWLGTLAKAASSRLYYAHVGLMRLVDTFLSPILPASWARIDLVVLEKPVPT